MIIDAFFFIMDIQQFTKIFNRLGYDVDISNYINKDDYNKIITMKDNASNNLLWYYLIDTALSYCPTCVRNFFNRSYEHKYGYTPTNPDLLDKMVLGYYTELVKSYRHISEVYVNMNVTFHPYVNRTLLDNFNVASQIFIEKLLDDNDDYFNVDHEQKLVSQDDITKIIEEELPFLKIIMNYGGALAGSVALAHYGSVYRDTIHDIDVILPITALSKELIQLIYETSQIQIMNKEKRDKEKVVPKLFKKTDLYKELYDLCNGLILIKDFNIDQISEYDKIAKGVIILTIEGKDYDLIFRETVNTKEFTNSKTGFSYNCQSLIDSFATKRLLGRPKDFQDLINFKKYEDR